MFTDAECQVLTNEIVSQDLNEVTERNSDLLQAFRSSWESVFSGGIHDWAEQNVVLHHSYAITGKLNLKRSKYLIAPLQSLKDAKIREVNCRAAVQTGKTLIGECLLTYLIANEAGNLLWLQSSDEMAKRFSDTRITPLLYNCDATRRLLPPDRFTVKKLDITFPHFYVHINGAKQNALQSLSIKYIVADEVWLYEPGFLSQAKSRLTAFQHTSKLLCISQAGTSQDDWNEQFNRGIIHEWGFKCPHCGELQPLVFNLKTDWGYAGIIWDTNETTKPNGQWNYKAASDTARLVCRKCKGEIQDTPQNRRMLNDTGDYIVTNPNGNPTIHSYQWNQLASMDISFASVVIKYLQAKDALDTYGYQLPLQEFYQQVLGIPWKQDSVSPLLELKGGDYAEGSDWNEAKYRLMAIDVQGNFQKFYWGIRDWSEKGSSRLVTCGTAETWEQLREIQLSYKVKDQCVLVDSGYEATEVYKKCIQYGHEGIVGGQKRWLSWIALKGSQNDYFNHVDPKEGKDIRIYSKPQFVNPHIGTNTKDAKRCPLYLWSNGAIKDMLYRFRLGKGPKWEIPNNPSFDLDEYNKHLNAERKRPIVDKKTGRIYYRWVEVWKDNHFLDVECMLLVGAAIIGILYKSNDNKLPDTK